MKDETNQDDENIVRFPERGQKFDLSPPIDDPLESLLKEFEDITKEIEDGYDAEPAVSRALEKLPGVKHSQILPEDLLAKEFSQALEFQTRINLLHEVNKRIKYYLDEIELFLPKTKK